MPYISVEPVEAQKLIQESEITILDMRDLNSFNGGHIPGAVPANDFAIEALIKKNNKSANILVYCYLGNSSRDLSSFLTKLGFKNVYNLIGGFTAWKKFSVQQKQQDVVDPVTAWLVNKGFDPANIRDRVENANSSLMEAAKDGELNIVNTLIARGADADLVNDDENIALWFACYSNHLDTVKTLIFSTSNINHQNVNGATCLSYAASTGKYEIVKVLIEAGADVDIETHDGFNAIELASTIEILKYLKNVHNVSEKIAQL